MIPLALLLTGCLAVPADEAPPSYAALLDVTVRVSSGIDGQATERFTLPWAATWVEVLLSSNEVERPYAELGLEEGRAELVVRPPDESFGDTAGCARLGPEGDYRLYVYDGAAVGGLVYATVLPIDPPDDYDSCGL
ncbi:MAG: hypothetical protein H6739_42530 [Alphaproteobacteria bacterium]|nr:hypothetical protein [Alphaproteobacteria bacterium]